MCEHGHEMYEYADGRPRCAVRAREKKREYYDKNAAYRITKNLKNDALKRRARLQAAKQRLKRGE